MAYGKTVVSTRVDDDLYLLIKQNSNGNISSYLNELILKGIMVELGELYESAKDFRESDNEINSKIQSEPKNLLPTQFEQETKLALIFLQEISANLAIKHGFTHEEIKILYERAKQKV